MLVSLFVFNLVIKQSGMKHRLAMIFASFYSRICLNFQFKYKFKDPRNSILDFIEKNFGTQEKKKENYGSCIAQYGKKTLNFFTWRVKIKKAAFM